MSEKEFNLIFSKNLNRLLSENDLTQADLAKYVGVTTAAVNTWCKGLKTPRMDKVDIICKFFNIRRSVLMEDLDSSCQDDSGYYLDDDAREAADFLFRNPEYKVLFDATRKVKKEDIMFVKEMIDRMSHN